MLTRLSESLATGAHRGVGPLARARGSFVHRVGHETLHEGYDAARCPALGPDDRLRREARVGAGTISRSFTTSRAGAVSNVRRHRVSVRRGGGRVSRGHTWHSWRSCRYPGRYRTLQRRGLCSPPPRRARRTGGVPPARGRRRRVRDDGGRGVGVGVAVHGVGFPFALRRLRDRHHAERHVGVAMRVRRAAGVLPAGRPRAHRAVRVREQLHRVPAGGADARRRRGDGAERRGDGGTGCARVESEPRAVDGRGSTPRSGQAHQHHARAHLGGLGERRRGGWRARREARRAFSA